MLDRAPSSFGLLSQSFDCDWTLETRLACDMLMEAGAKYEEFGPGIVVRHEGQRWGTLRYPSGTTKNWAHLQHRGSDERDYGTGLLTYRMNGYTWYGETLTPDPFKFEEL